MDKHNRPRKGDRVTTKHGPGEVAGFEQFDPHGKSLPLSDIPTGYRVAIALDPGHTWVFDGLCYFWEVDLYSCNCPKTTATNQKAPLMEQGNDQ
jgi:hypothetical protein